LNEKTRGRILLSDQGIADPAGTFPSDGWEELINRVRLDPGPDQLWIEYDVC
jgi:hypothetical protein